MIRSFFAIAVSDSVERQLIETMRSIQPELCRQDLRWVAPENFHITLAFLGDTRDADIDKLTAIARSVALQHSPMSLALKDIAWFPSANKPRMLVALPEANESLKRLQADLNQQLRRHGFPIENRRFRPHITLARCRRGAVAAPLSNSALDISWAVDELQLMQSQLHPSGSRYTSLFAASLGA